jgi:DNA-binding IclR family transcriptional regulator
LLRKSRVAAPLSRRLSVSDAIEAIERLKGVFLEIPGTRLTVAQASRLAGVERSQCHAVLVNLEDARFLKRGRDGLYQLRSTDSPRS